MTVESVLQLASSLKAVILALLGFLLPLFAVGLTVFSEGISLLSSKKQGDISKLETTIKELMNKKPENESIPEMAARAKSVNKQIKDLENKRKEAQKKIDALVPKTQLKSLATPLIFSLVSVLLLDITSIKENSDLSSVLLLISIIFTIVFFYALWRSAMVIIDAQKEIDAKKNIEQSQANNQQEQARQTLQSLLTVQQLQYNEQQKSIARKIFVTVDGSNITNEIALPFTLFLEKEQELKIGVRNAEDRTLAKNVEAGLQIPYDLEVMESTSYSIYKDEKNQIVRFNFEQIHPFTHFFPNSSLKIKPHVLGSYQIQTFLKGENVETKKAPITINIISAPQEGIT